MRNSRYWLFQIPGWCIFALLNIYVAYLTTEISVSVILIDVGMALSGLLLTHYYRHTIFKRGWLNLKTDALVKYVFLSNTLLSAAYSLLYYFLYLLVFGVHHFPVFSSLLGTFCAAFFLMGLWNAFYFSWVYIERNRSLHIQQLKMESALKDLEIKTIKANLQPHFIFNSLNSIRALIDEDPMLAREAVTKISNILRRTIAQKNELVSLETELELVNDYLDLEKIRFEDRLQVIRKIAPDTLSRSLPSMMMQTLVENAIKHGISSLENGGELIIESELEQDTLKIEIKNSGSLQTPGKNENSLSFGLKATRQRLHYFYGNEAAFDIMEEKPYVVCTLLIPKIPSTP